MSVEREPRLAGTLLFVAAASIWPSAARADLKACLSAAEDGQKMRDGGAYRRARERFIACAADECPGEVRKGCVGWLGELEKVTPTVVFGAHAGAREVTDVRVTLDGEVVTERIDGKPVVLDPGEHHLRFERAGDEAVDQIAVLLAGEKERLITVRFGPEPSAAPAAPLPPRDASGGREPPGETPSRSRAVLYVLGAAALTSFAAGTALDVSGYVFLQQCNGDSTCTGAHERAEVEWRFVTGDILLGVAVVSAVSAWLIGARDTHVASAGPRAVVGAGCLRGGATAALTMSF